MPGGPVERTIEYVAPFEDAVGSRTTKQHGSFLKKSMGNNVVNSLCEQRGETVYDTFSAC